MQRYIFIIFIILTVFTACRKEAGEGGTAVITGKIYAKNYTNGWLVGEYYAPEERVYIVYGNSSVYNNDMRTHYDGSYRFDYLYPGTYIIYAYSDCDTCPSKTQAVLDTVEITGEGQVVTVPDIVVRR